ncbi:MAG: DUF5050 domain-containing protein [Spartobacteria bacterium]|nr:DUF5050 domain-containing protein [Spartobacteria bacterium]
MGLAVDAFTYEGAGIDVLGIGDASIASGEAPSVGKGSDFGRVMFGGASVHSFKLDNSGDEANDISGWAITGSDAFTCSLPTNAFSVDYGDQQSFTITFSPNSAGTGHYEASLLISNSSPIGVYTVLVAGTEMFISPTNIGPYSGGNTITISNGYFGTITNVLVGAPSVGSALLLDHGTNWFTITLPSASAAGITDIIIQTSDNDDITLSGAYTYRPQGIIGVQTPDLHDVLCQYEFDNALTDSQGNGLEMVPTGNSASGFTADGWQWTAESSTTGGLSVDGPESLAMTSNFTIRIKAKYPDVSGWKRFMYFPSSAYGPYIYDGRLYFYDIGSGPYGPQNTDDQWIDLYLTRDGSTGETILWQVVDGEVILGDSGFDYSPFYIAPDSGTRTQWRFFGDDQGYGMTQGTVQDIWMWDQSLTSNDISDIYHGSFTGGVTPASGSTAGGFTVTISGSNLGDGSDITSVTLCGVAATIDSQSATQIVVTAGSAGGVITGDVVVVSTAFGTTMRTNAFVYEAEAAPSVEPSIGPFAGGNTIVISNISGSVTNVLIGGLQASLAGSGAGWVSVTVPFLGTSGAEDIILQRDGDVDLTLSAGYTYRPQGVIGGSGGPSGWTADAGLPQGRSYCTAATLDNMLYSIGGADSSFQNTTNVYRFDGALWSEVAGLPEARNGMASAALDGSLYAIGGHYGTTKTNVYRFDGSAWTEVAGLPVPRRYMNAATWNGAIYVVAGQNSTMETNVFRFDGISWTEVAGLPVACNYSGVSSWNGHLYAVGGGAGMSTLTNVYRYDGTNWSELAGLPVGRTAMGCAALDDAIYAYGGNDDSFMPGTNAFRFDGTSWSEIEGLSKAVNVLGGASLSGMVYAIGGSDMSSSVTNVCRYSSGEESSGVDPEFGSTAGGFTVTISGINLGDGSDVTNVTLCGVAATIDSQSATQIVVTAGVAGGAVTGDVVVVSTGFGTTTRSNAFTYTAAAEPIVQPDIGPYTGGNSIVITNTAGTITNVLIGGSTAPITDSDADWVAVTVPGASVAGAVSVTLQRDGAGDITLTDVYTYRPQGQIGYTFPGPDMIYWTDRDQNKIGRIAGDGSGETDLVTGLSNPRPIDTDGEYLYYGNNGYNPVIRCNLDGSGSTTLINEIATALCVNDEYIYYTDWNTGVKRANKDGSGITTLISGSVLGGNTWGFQAIYVTDDTIYFGNYGDNKIYTRGLSGGTTNLLYDLGEGGSPTSLQVDDTHVYVGNGNNSSGIVRTDLDGSNPTEIGAADRYYDIALLGDKLYYVNSGADVGRMNLDGSGQVAMATNGAGTHGIAALVSQVEVAGIEPSSGSDTGGYPVVISGTNLCNGSADDVTSVTLRGVAASVVSVAGSTQIVVTAGASGATGIGDVVVQSTDFGTTTKANAFTYEASEFTITATAGANGSISPSGDVVVQGGSDQLFTFTPDSWYRIQDVLVNDASLGGLSSYNWTNIMADGTITVSFAEAYVTTNTPVPVPEKWMAEYGLTNGMDAEVKEDPDGDGASTWQEYVMDTNPTNMGSVLTLDNMQFDANQLLEWYASSGRVYTMYWSTNMLEGVTNVLFSGFRPDETGMANYTDTVQSVDNKAYYRVKVAVP